jgi:hypothetical protein
LLATLEAKGVLSGPEIEEMLNGVYGEIERIPGLESEPLNEAQRLIGFLKVPPQK